MKISRWTAAAAAMFTLAFAHAQTPLPVPRKASEFTISMVGSKPLLLSEYKGKPVILAFILTECQHCQDAVKILTKLQTEFAPKGLQVLAAAIERDADKHVALFRRNFQPTFPVGYTTSGLMGAFVGQLGPDTTMPVLEFIDGTGTIIYQTTGDMPFFKDEEANIRKQIAILLKAPGAPAAKKAAPKSTKK